jgi:S-sulfo-L-cysteine synthase (O-acetyl-L-serine-dependent)
MIYKNLLKIIGNTPIVELKSYSNNPKVRIFAKLEGGNPGGSIKDRVALRMIMGTKIDANKVLIEPTSGNTGIGLAMISAMLGYKFLAVMKRSASVEKIKLMESFGARVILADETIDEVREMVKINKNLLWLNQYENKANVMAHYYGTGLEIIRDIPEISYFVAGMGTGGTLMGVGKRLKEFNSKIKIIGLEPKQGTKIQGLRNMDEYVPKILDLNKLDAKLNIEDEAAFELAKDLSKREGLSVGISSGANLWGAIELSKKIEEGTIVTVFPDRGDRYISTNLFV